MTSILYIALEIAIILGLIATTLYYSVRTMTLKREINLCRRQLEWYEKRFEERKKV